MDIDEFMLYDELPFWSAPFGIALLDTVRVFHGMKVLDLGSGAGFPMLELAGRIGSPGRVYGIDPSESSSMMIREKIRLREIDNAEVMTGVAESLPFGDNFFDLVTANNGINNVQDQEKSLRECYRVMKPGGQAVMTVNLPHTMDEFYEAFEATLHEMGMDDYILRVRAHIAGKRKPAEFLRDLVRKCGFEIKSILPDGFKYRYASPEAFFRSYFIRMAFLPSWEEIPGPEFREEVFRRIREKLAGVVREKGCLEMSVPYACFDFYKPA